MLSILSGLALNLSSGVAVSGLPRGFGDLAYQLLAGIPVPVLIALLVLAISHLVLRYTRLGRHIYAVGGNVKALNVQAGQQVEAKDLLLIIE